MDPVQEGVGLLVLLDAFVEPVERLRPDRFENGLPSPMSGLRSHQDPDLVELLPIAVESEQGAHLEAIRSRCRDAKNDAGPLLQVPESTVQPETLLSTMKSPVGPQAPPTLLRFA